MFKKWKKLITICLCILLMSCGGDTQVVSTPILTGIQITPSKIKTAKGYMRQYHAIGSLSDNTTLNLTDYVTWHSSDGEIVTVSEEGAAYLVNVGEAQVFATLDLDVIENRELSAIAPSSGYLRASLRSNTSTVQVTDARLEGIQLIAPVDTVPKGYHLQFHAVGLFSDTSTLDLSAQVQWKSSDTGIAEVNQEGEVNFLEEGTVTITASRKGIDSNQLDMAVTSATISKIQITTEKDQIAKGYTQDYQAIATFSDQSTVDVTDQVQWSSSDATIASVTVQGRAHFFEEGYVTIKAEREGIESNLSFIKVNPAELISLQLLGAKTEIAAGYSQQYQAIGSFSDNSSMDLTDSVDWHSSDLNLATVTSGGRVDFLSQGRVSIYVTQKGIISNYASVEVLPLKLTELQISAPSSNIAKGFSQQLQAIATFSDKSTLDVSDDVDWISGDMNIATISEQGKAHFINQGEVEIQAFRGDVYSNSALIKVTPAVITEIQISAPLTEIAKGYKQHYQAIGIFSDQSNQDITTQVSWQSSNMGVATVTNDGYADFKEEGDVVITASKSGITSNEVQVTVTAAELIQLDISAPVDEIAKGYLQQYQAIGIFSDQHAEDLSSQVDWHSGDTNIVTISANGVAQMNQEGMTEITATHGRITSNVLAITVTPATLKSIKISAPEEEIAMGYTQHYTAEGVFSDNHVEDLTHQVSWHSSDLTIAVISPQGHANFMSEGTVEITAHLDGIDSNVMHVKVVGAKIMSMVITQKFYNMTLGRNALYAGSTLEYRVMGFFSDMSSLDVTNEVSWRVVDTLIATVDSNGVVSGVKEGETELEVSHPDLSHKTTVKVKVLTQP